MEEGKNIYWEHLLVFATVGQSGFGETRKMSICSGLEGDGGLGQELAGERMEQIQRYV